MGLQMALNKESNFLFHDFLNAYWCIENLRYVNNNGVNYTIFDFNAYPSRDAKYQQGLQMVNQYDFGTAEGLAYNPRLYHWEAVFETAAIFPEGIPLAEPQPERHPVRAGEGLSGSCRCDRCAGGR
jgi:hypothetical protein